MAKTWTINVIGLRVLLAAMTIQVLTPDTLDLALLEHDQLPGPVHVIVKLVKLGKAMCASPPLAARGVFLHLPKPSPGRAEGSDHRSGDLGEPLWPEVALARNAKADATVQLKRGLCWLRSPGHGLVNGVRPHGPSLGQRYRTSFLSDDHAQDSLCRLRC